MLDGIHLSYGLNNIIYHGFYRSLKKQELQS